MNENKIRESIRQAEINAQYWREKTAECQRRVDKWEDEIEFQIKRLEAYIREFAN